MADMSGVGLFVPVLRGHDLDCLHLRCGMVLADRGRRSAASMVGWD